jgi:maltose O-acetyltransferase
MIGRILASLYRLLQKAHEIEKMRQYRAKFYIHPTVSLGPGVTLDGNIHIGAHSYINSGVIQSGCASKVVIGEWCAIAYNVSIIAITHDNEISTGLNRPVVECDIYIGDHVWIGSNVYIREGCSVGNNSIIGSNSVVINDVPDNAIVGGIPAKIIRFKNCNI